ncbi:MAG TPA: Gfo/Idh/MocA family oxidoreductase [Ilumatobacter sp.]|nr:Gfo/Idh/MocA family oxidoreductase [Ilumatobacter sp.]
MTGRLRVAVVGCGAVSAVVGERGYGALRESVELVAAIDLRIERARAVAEQTGARPYESLAQALRDEEIDAVDVRVPHRAHAAVAAEAIAAGKHVMVDKPMATSLDDARSLVSTAAAAGVVLSVAENYTFYEPVLAAARELADGTIGELVAVRTHRVAYLDDVWLADGWRLDRDAGGGVLLDQGCHFTNILRRTVGEIEAVQAFVSTRAPRWRADDSAVVNCRFAGGLIGQQLYTFASATPAFGAEAYFYGTAGSLEIHTGYVEPTGGLVRYTPEHPDGEWLDTGRIYDETFAPTIDDWVRACRGEQAPTMSGDEGLRDLAVVLAAYRSVQTGSVEPVVT